MTEPSITLHSSWRGILMSFFGASAVFAIGVVGTAGTRGAVIPLGILVIGTGLLFAMLFDYPVASKFTADGVVRRAPLRRHRIAWDRVDQLTRTRPVLTLGLRQLTPGGLAAKIGRRRYLLVDQCESMAEFDELSEVLDERFVELAIDEMIVPPEATIPTWTYRTKRWEREPDR